MAVIRCRRCHRILKTPECVKIGFGRVCFTKMTGNPFPRKRKEPRPKQDKKPRRDTAPGKFKGDIVCRRNENGTATVNLPQSVVYHSPTGFEWGYGGSGPADLALNILCRFLDEETAQTHHQDFKWQLIAVLPFEGGTIKNQAIREWLEERGLSYETRS